VCYENRVLRYRNRIARDAIHSSREGGKLLLSGTVERKKVNVSVKSEMSNLV